MKKIKNPFGLYNKKELTYIKTDDYENMNKYKDCYCTNCGEKLIPRMGKKNIWHFSHMNNNICNGNFETSLHMYAKQVIKNNNKILLPCVIMSEYIKFNKMQITNDLVQWCKLNYKNFYDLCFIKENIYSYKWISNEIKIDNFIPDCIIEINGKKLAVEIFVTHAVDEKKEDKVEKNKLDMLEIYLGDVLYEMDNRDFDMNKYILFNAVRSWIYKTKVISEEKKLYYKIYNSGNFILNIKHTNPQLYKKRKNEERIEKLEREKEARIEYVLKHKDIYEKKHKNKVKYLLRRYSLIEQSKEENIFNIPVKGEYAFAINRNVWQEKIYNKFIYGREGKFINLAKIISWIDNHSDIKYYKEFNTFSNSYQIWNSKYDAVKLYFEELRKMGIIYSYDEYISKWTKLEVINSNIQIANSKLKLNKNNIFVCSACGEIKDKNDYINKFYINNFNMDRDCFEKKLL